MSEHTNVYKNIDRNEERNSNMIIYFNTSFSIMDKSSREKINKETDDLNNALYKMDLIDLIRFPQQQQQKTHHSFPSVLVNRTFQGRSHYNMKQILENFRSLE